MENKQLITEEEYLSMLKRITKPTRLMDRCSYYFLKQNELLQSDKVIKELVNIVSSTRPYKAKLEAYKTCKKLGIDCPKPKHNFTVDPVECQLLAPVFQLMKKNKWLKPYNAPKFRVAFNIVNSKEYRERIKGMGERKKKETMFKLYRKYYMYFIDEDKLSQWLNDWKEKGADGIRKNIH